MEHAGEECGHGHEHQSGRGRSPGARSGERRYRRVAAGKGLSAPQEADDGHDRGFECEWHEYTYAAMARESCVLVFLSTSCYINSLHGEFVFDDIIAVQENLDVRPETPLAKIFEHDFWGTDITDWQSHKSYRPLTILSFRLSYYIAGYHWNEFQFHLVNVVLHAIVTLLALPTARLCFMTGPQAFGQRRQAAAFWAAAFFAVHPIHTDAVSSIVSRGEMLSGAFLLLSFLAYSRAADVVSRQQPLAPDTSPSSTPTLSSKSIVWCVIASVFWVPLSVALAFVVHVFLYKYQRCLGSEAGGTHSWKTCTQSHKLQTVSKCVDGVDERGGYRGIEIDAKLSAGSAVQRTSYHSRRHPTGLDLFVLHSLPCRVLVSSSCRVLVSSSCLRRRTCVARPSVAAR
jgi:hypothetical protein